MGKSGTVDTTVDELSVLRKAVLSKLLGLFDDKAGWWYPVLRKVGEGNGNNPSVPDIMGLEAESELQLMKKMGLVIHKQPHGWKINQRAWTTFLQRRRCLEWNSTSARLGINTITS
jgi:hypothetical protein